MLSPKFLLICTIAGLQLLAYADGDPMIEVFKWKQMDFYNRGDGYKDLWSRLCIPGKLIIKQKNNNHLWITIKYNV